MRRKKLFLFLLLIGPSLLACSSQHPKTKDLFSPDGKFRLTVPGGWTEEKDLHDSADIQAAHKPSQMYVIVLSETKEDLKDMTLEEHSKLTREGLMKGVQDPIVVGPKSLVVDGHPALQYEIRGSVEHVNIVYLHTTVDGGKYFHQILAWTVPSRFAQNQATLEEVTRRFHEMP
ncbi:MAG: hypothetical protein U1F66_12660 [bacterium]